VRLHGQLFDAVGRHQRQGQRLADGDSRAANWLSIRLAGMKWPGRWDTVGGDFRGQFEEHETQARQGAQVSR
jgi:hypothetical protein